MADIMLKSGTSPKRTSVPHSFIDRYMPRANGEYVKVYIYILRCFDDESMSISTSDIADLFDMSEKSVIRALEYWEKEKLISLSFNRNAEITGITLLGEDVWTEIPDHTDDRRSSLRDDDVMGREISSHEPDILNPLENDAVTESDRRELVQIAETYLGRPLSSVEVEKLFSWMDDLFLPYEVIDYLIDYSVSHGHDSFSYMDKIALSWAGRSIKTVDEAKKHSFETDMQPLFRQIQEAYGLTGRVLTPTEKEYVKKWVSALCMPSSLIINACQRTIKNTGKASFEYTDSILKSWYSKNATTPEAVSALDNEYRTRFIKVPGASDKKERQKKEWNFDQRDYDMSQVEKKLLQKA